MDLQSIIGALQSATQNRLRDCTDEQLALLFDELRLTAVRVIVEQMRRMQEAEAAKEA